MGKAIELDRLRKKYRGNTVRETASQRAAPDLRLGAKEAAASGQMNIRVTDDFKRVLGDGARDLGVSMAQLVEDAVRDYLARRRKR